MSQSSAFTLKQHDGQETGWIDRISEYPNRRTLTDSTSGDVQTVTVAREEGDVTNPGDAFNAQNMNDLENRIDSAFKVHETNFQAGVDTIRAAIVRNGVTPSSSTPAACSAAIDNIRNGGNATAGQILKTRTAIVNKQLVTGSMENYSGGNRRTVTPSGGNGNETLSLSAGYHDSVIVNRTNPYNAGKSAAEGVTTSLTTMLMDYANGKSSTSEMYISAKNIQSIKYTDFWCSTTPSDASVYVEFYQANGTTLISSVECTTSGQNISIPSGAVYAMFKVYVQLSTSQTFQYRARWNVTWQMKVLR